MTARGALAIFALFAAAAARADDARPISGAEAGDPPPRVLGGTVAADVREPARGAASWRLTRAGDAPAALVFALPAGVDAARWPALAWRLRAEPTTAALRLRWRALDDAGRPLFQRRVEHDAGLVWTRLEEPLALWRWADGTAGRWADVRGVALVVEEGPRRLWVDDVRLVGPPATGAARLPPRRLDALAFPERAPWVGRGDGVRLVHALDDLPPRDDLEALLARLEPIPRWLDRLAGGAAPPPDPRPLTVLLHADRAAFEAFLGRLGAAWRAGIAPPRAGGYTLQDVPSVVWDAERGLDRPVILHEVVHAWAARRLGLIPGSPAHDWLQEGLANYLQLCLYPESLPAGTYGRLFARPIDPTGGGFFQPLERLTAERAGARRYAQLASVVAFLTAERPAVLAALIRGLARGRTAPAVLAAQGTSLAELQADWRAWGARSFPADGEPAAGAGRRFPTPPEWGR